jgi:hypothetical protein
MLAVQLQTSPKVGPHRPSSSSKFEPHNHRENVSDKLLSAVWGPAPRYYKSLNLDLKPLKMYFIANIIATYKYIKFGFK